MRTRYSKVARKEMVPATCKKQLRNRACLPLEEEGALPDGILGQAMQGGVVIVPPLQRKFVETFGKPVALSSRSWPRSGRDIQRLISFFQCGNYCTIGIEIELQLSNHRENSGMYIAYKLAIVIKKAFSIPKNNHLSANFRCFAPI